MSIHHPDASRSAGHPVTPRITDYSRTPPGQRIGRYVLCDEIARGGMATVHLGVLRGPARFARTVAIKRLHPTYARDPYFAVMFLDEARMAARLRHPNVVPILDVVQADDELSLVMEYVEGESLSRLLKASRRLKLRLPVPVAVSIIVSVLEGLHAAHEALSDDGKPLHIVHRDVSPQNILIGAEGVPRLVDFGIAKARGRMHNTIAGELKGKLAYMAPEQLEGGDVDRQTDVYAAGLVLWELLAGRRLFRAETDLDLFARVLEGATDPPSRHRADVPAEIDRVVMKALALSRADRYPTARAFACALEDAMPLASARKIGGWVQDVAGASLARRAAMVAFVESQPDPADEEPRSDAAVSMDRETVPHRPPPPPPPVRRVASRARRHAFAALVGLTLLGLCLDGASIGRAAALRSQLTAHVADCIERATAKR